MAQQRNKVEKRKRRKAYITRKRDAIKAHKSGKAAKAD